MHRTSVITESSRTTVRTLGGRRSLSTSGTTMMELVPPSAAPSMKELTRGNPRRRWERNPRKRVEKRKVERARRTALGASLRTLL